MKAANRSIPFGKERFVFFIRLNVTASTYQDMSVQFTDSSIFSISKQTNQCGFMRMKRNCNTVKTVISPNQTAHGTSVHSFGIPHLDTGEHNCLFADRKVLDFW